jgi:hypothetical protein
MKTWVKRESLFFKAGRNYKVPSAVADFGVVDFAMTRGCADRWEVEDANL